MSLVKTHKVALAPTLAQGALLAQHAGYARVAYNHALADFRACLDRGEWLTDMDLRPRFNALKREAYPWCAGLSQNASKYAAINLGDYDAASLAESLNGRGGHVSPPAATAEAGEALTQATPSFLTADLLAAAE